RVEATEELLGSLLGTDPPGLLREVVAQAEGNPFFMEEVLGSLIDQGLLEQRNGAWAMRELPNGFLVPDTVQALVAARIDLIKHAVTREVAYKSIPKARRAHLHADFASWIERFGGRRDEYAPLLAHHYAEAARPEDADLAWAGAEEEFESLRSRAVTWLRRAA